MAKIDWKKLPDGVVGYDLIPAEPDWDDPTHVPLMVADVVFRIGNLSECLDDDEHAAACLAALDAMPGGRAAVEDAVEEAVRGLAAAHGWSDYLIDPATGRYPWEDE